jgi:hypothetical protein
MTVVIPRMDWKSTTVISGAGILATWFFSMPPASTPSGATAPSARADQAATANVDIEREAARLQVRPHQEPRYTEPSRNPFRFTERAPAKAPAPVAPPEPLPPLPPPPPRLTLDGVAADVVDGQPQRTAVLNTDGGVVLAKEGDQVAGYRVEKIASDAVELVKIEDGSMLRLGLR